MLLIFNALEYESLGLLAWRIAALALLPLSFLEVEAKLALTPLNWRDGVW